MSTTSTTIFSGTSRYSNDFKSVIDRAVAIASLPITQMQNDETAMNNESSALSSLDSRFSALQTAIGTLATATSSGTYSSFVSDTTVLTASVSGSPMAGTYSVEVTKFGSYTSANGAAGFATVTDPTATAPSTAASYTLSVGGTGYTITPKSQNLNAIADAINAQTAANVRATVINLGSSSAPDYRLSLQSTTLGAISLGLSDSVIASTTATDVTSRGGLSFTSAATFDLTVDGQHYSLTGAATLDDLAQKINDKAIDGVTAEVTNLGTAEKPDYRLHILTSGKTVGLSENLLTTPAANLGSQAGYKINGSDEILTDSRSITVAPGLTAQMQKTGGPVTVTVSRSTTGITNAISSFVTAYNAAVDEIANHYSASKSALDGNSILMTASNVLSQIVAYGGSGPFPYLVSGYGASGDTQDIGLSLSKDNDGKLTFDSSRFSQNTTGKMDDLLSMLGGTTTGGFLKSATDLLNTLEDANTGTLKTAITDVKNQIKEQDQRISDKQNQVDDLQKNLEARMAAADAAVAAMEQQVTYITNLFASMQQASKTQ